MHAIVKELKQNNEDFEWYPTKQNMIEAIIQDIQSLNGKTVSNKAKSILEIGAGDCRVVNEISKHCGIQDISIIEKAQTFIAKMPLNIKLIGTDFYSTDLSDKPVNIIFSNPPYSDYANWFATIVEHAFCSLAYLIVPERWINNESIKSALKKRNVDAQVIFSDDFLDGERQARAKVDIIRLNFTQYGRNEQSSSRFNAGDYFSYRDSDPFDYLFSETFGDLEQNFTTDKLNEAEEKWNTKIVALKNRTSEVNIESLVDEYEQELDHLYSNYRSILSLDANLIHQLGLDLEKIKVNLRGHIHGLKHKYWEMFFNVYDVIYQYCTAETLDILKRKLSQQTSIEFNKENIYAMTTLILRYAEMYKEQQLINWFYRLSESDNVKLYKSNQRVFKDEDWRYIRRNNENCNDLDNKPSHYQLDYRIVTRYLGRIDGWFNQKEVANHLNDLTVIARTLRLNAENQVTLSDAEKMKYGQRYPLYFTDQSGEKQVLAEVKFFKNGNAHLFLNQDFTLRLNVEVGRLLGWVKTKEQASEEMGYPLEEVEKSFGASQNLLMTANKLLLTN